MGSTQTVRFLVEIDPQDTVHIVTDRVMRDAVTWALDLMTRGAAQGKKIMEYKYSDGKDSDESEYWVKWQIVPELQNPIRSTNHEP